MSSCYYSLMLFDNWYLLTQLILTEMRWRGLCQAALLACLCAGTLRGGGEKHLLWPSCLQCTQLPAVRTAVCREHSCLYGTQLSIWHTAVFMMHSCQQAVPMFAWHTAGCMAHSSAWGTAVPRGTAVSACTALRGTQLSQGA